LTNRPSLDEMFVAAETKYQEHKHSDGSRDKMDKARVAKAMMHEDVAGSIEAGKHADMIVLDRNLFEIEPTDISDVKVLKTIFAGKVVYSAK